MASTDIKTLINFLQNNGGLVISGQTKFTITAPILKEINQITQTIKDDLFVSKIRISDLISKYSNNDELLFLYDFIKKTPKLKITNSVSSQKMSVDISDFSCLKYLELYKINVKDVKGIQNLRETLEAVLCFRCLKKLCDLLLNSDAEQLGSCMWGKLRHLVLPRNDLVSIDESFIHTPWLQYLDLSYNQLSDIRQLTCLRHLTHLNVSYNHLKVIPKFTMFKLKVLLLNNNYIIDISGVATLESLQELNLSDNCVAEHASLIPLAELPSLRSLKMLRNPINYHPMYRSFTCGYLHENIANVHFLLDDRPMTTSEREFIRYSSRAVDHIFTSPSESLEQSSSVVNAENFAQITNSVVKKKLSKKVRDAKIADSSQSNELSFHNQSDHSIAVTIDEESDDEDLKQIKALREHGPDHWLSTTTFGGNMNMPSSSKSEDTSSGKISPLFFPSPKISGSNSQFDVPLCGDEAIDYEISTSTTDVQSIVAQVSEASEESSDEENPLLEGNLWLVEKVDENSKDSRFLVLNDCELKEVDTVKQKLITRWSIDSIQRYTKISSEPFTLILHFEVPKRENRFRKYVMEYADAQVLMSRIDKELEERHLNDQIILRCIKCDFVFCHEKPKRKLLEVGVEEQKTVYVCPTCHSSAVIEEDLPELENKRNVSDTSIVKKDIIKHAVSLTVTPSPSASSIGSAASLEQNSDSANNEEAHSIYHESDVEIISNPSESSIEVLHREPNGSTEGQKTVLRRLSERLSISEISTSDLTSVTAALNQVLTESSSSGSMTDSSCTTIESNYHLGRPHRISQSTIDQVLPEESSAETSPQQRRSEERNTSELSKNNKNDTTNSHSKTDRITISTCVSALEEVLSKVLPSTISPRIVPHQICSPFDYSYTDFSHVDYRIKFYLWGEVIPNNEEIIAFVKVQAIGKSNQLDIFFPGFVALTNKKLYMIKITSEIEDEENFGSWLQKFDIISVEKLMLFRPLLWKQGFCIQTNERGADGCCVQYLMLLYDQKRTDNYLCFVKDLGTVHVQKTDEYSVERTAFSLIQVEEHIRNLTMTNRISICVDQGAKTVYDFVALVVTNNKFVILKGEVKWLLPNSSGTPTIIREEQMTNLIGVKEIEDGIVLPFLDEIEVTETSWRIKTVSAEATDLIIKAIQEPWEEFFGINLPILSE